MLTVESMSHATGSYNTKFLEFTRIHARKPDCLICFFEGKDDDRYYGFRITQILGVEWKGVDCNGKEKVLPLFRMLENHTHEAYRNAKTAFFVDRDFDEPQPPEIRSKVYETPCYSIENLYTTPKCFKQIIEIGFKIKEINKEEDEALFKACVKFFIETRRQFHEAVSRLNAWMMLVRRKEKDASGKQITHFEKIKLERLVSIDVHQVTARQSVSDYLTELFPFHGISEEAIDATVSSFSKESYGEIFRGKYEIEFLWKFLTRLKDDLCSNSPRHFSEKRKISFPIPSLRNIISELSSYADTPECLKNYLLNKSEDQPVKVTDHEAC